MMRRLILLLAMTTALVAHAADALEFRPFKRGSWGEIKQAHAGKPFIVHFWGVTCGPCRVEMPEWGSFLAARPQLNLVVINADLVPNSEQAASRMIEDAGLSRAEQWMFDQSNTQRLRYEVDPKWQGEIPLTLMIDASGKATRLEGTADLGVVGAWLDTNLPKPADR